jgi:hypothetical protein
MLGRKATKLSNGAGRREKNRAVGVYPPPRFSTLLRLSGNYFFFFFATFFFLATFFFAATITTSFKKDLV